jgi:hypothetical protein
MTCECKYSRALKFLEINYYSIGKPDFDRILNQFLTYYKVETIPENKLNFQDNIKYLNSISSIMVDKFICVIFDYFQKDQPIDYEDFEFFDDSIFEYYSSSSSRIRFRIGNDSTIYRIHLNEDNVFYCANYPPEPKFNIFNIFKKSKKIAIDKDPSRFLNTKDLAEFLKINEECKSQDEEIELKILFKSIIGKQ